MCLSVSISLCVSVCLCLSSPPYWLFSKTGMLVGASGIEIYSQMQAGMGGDQVETVNYYKWALVIKIGSRVENTLVLTHRALWLYLINCRIPRSELNKQPTKSLCNNKKQKTNKTQF